MNQPQIIKQTKSEYFRSIRRTTLPSSDSACFFEATTIVPSKKGQVKMHRHSKMKVQTRFVKKTRV